LEQRLERAAEIAADSIDRDTDRRIALLQTLASSPLVSGEDWPRFYEQAKTRWPIAPISCSSIRPADRS